MTGDNTDGREVLEVARYGTGRMPVDEAEAQVEAAWRSIVSDEASLSEAARASGLAAADLAAVSGAPFVLKERKQGIAGVDDALLILAGTILTELVKDLAKDAAREGLTKLWSFVRKRMSRDALGQEAPRAEAGEEDGGSVSPGA